MQCINIISADIILYNRVWIEYLLCDKLKYSI
jgi:hypothetical protein